MILTFGDVIQDILVQTKGPIPVGSDIVGRISFREGGSAANFASWVAYLSYPVRFVGRVGEDMAGARLLASFSHPFVESSLVKAKGVPTGTIVVLVDSKGERTMITSRGANLCLTKEDFPPSVFSSCTHLHFTGYSLFEKDSLQNAAVYAKEQAKARNLTVSLDPSSYALLEELTPDRFFRLTEGVDLLFPNYEEGRVLSGKEDPYAIVEVLRAYYPMVVLTLGGRGCLYSYDKETRLIPTEKQEAEDTTGAGDCFAACYVVTFLQTKDPKEAALRANAQAKKSILQVGARPF